MKIAFITPFPPYRGGISKHSENIYNELKKNHQIDVFNFKRQYPDFLFPGKTQYLKDNKKEYNSFRIIDSINPLSWKKTSLEIVEGKYNKVIFRFWHPFFAPAYISIIKNINKLTDTPSFYAICDNIIPHENFLFQKFLIRNFLSKLDKIIIMSDQVENEVKSIDDNYNYKKLFLPILNDLNPLIDKNDACRNLGIANDKINFLFFGLIRDYKGLDVFLNSLNYLDKSIEKNIRILIAGEFYDNKIKYKNLCKNKNIEIKWFDNYIPDNLVHNYFCASDFAVLPYKTASQSGIIPMAYHFNTPVIVSNLDSLVKNVVIGKTGLKFESENAKSLASLITNIMNKHQKHDFLYINEYKNNYSTKLFIKKLILILNSK